MTTIWSVFRSMLTLCFQDKLICLQGTCYRVLLHSFHYCKLSNTRVDQDDQLKFKERNPPKNDQTETRPVEGSGSGDSWRMHLGRCLPAEAEGQSRNGRNRYSLQLAPALSPSSTPRPGRVHAGGFPEVGLIPGGLGLLQ